MMALHYVTQAATFVLRKLASVLLAPNSTFSAASLFCALCVAVGFVLVTRRRNNRSVSYRAMARALFPSWLYRNASFRADVGFFLFNILAFGALFGWALFSSSVISRNVATTLTNYLGAAPPLGLPAVLANALATAGLFLAYEFAYWFDHYLSHRVGWLWEFHKVHHTAEVLSPLTNFRVHPIDSIVFGNIVALIMGTAHGVTRYLQVGGPLGGGAYDSVILLAFVWILGHLQHSHFWISFTGPVGRVILSPAHHQIHHSDNPKHFNKNFGSALSVFDWLFGTLHLPERNKERLRFGVGERMRHHHTAIGGLLTPFVTAGARLRQRRNSSRRERSARSARIATPSPAQTLARE
jgi:sterol desaturase/sphingolipid hydroxylase (fatty acid hydroxylase superfamily)